jgi:hypothetical protein
MGPSPRNGPKWRPISVYSEDYMQPYVFVQINILVRHRTLIS